MVLLSLEVRRETNSRSSREREAVLLLHDIHIKRDLRGHVRLFSFFFQKGMLLGGFDVEKIGSDTCS